MVNNLLDEKKNREIDRRLPKGNISKITDHMNETRNQEFEYDNINRITKAVGKYGEETYNYNQNGNLTKRGKFNLQYNNPGHVHAVTQANSIETGAINYQYDSIGNLTNRNGDMYRYDSKSKLREITTAGGDVFTYTYDHTGHRIKKYLKNADTTTYSFGNVYEVHRSPGVPERHTLFINGISGDLVSQYTRPDANLLNEVAVTSSVENDQDVAFMMITVYNEIKRDLTLVWDGIPSIQILRSGYTVVAPVKLFLWIGLLLLMIYIAINISSEIKVSARFASALALVPFLFINIYSCSPLFYGGASGEEGVPPWLLGLGIPSDTQSVNSPTNTSGGGGGGSASQATARIPGMFFMHPDHLGSITMLTDGYGNVLAGGEMGGKSHITYKPYGEILRTDSHGPDVSKYKYTGQEEDMESGLYYYKARYYDPAMGRFTQADNMAFPSKIQGMNRMMYVEGNPVKYGDSSGNRISNSWAYAAVAYIVAKQGGDSDQNAMMWAAAAYGVGRAKDKKRGGFARNNDISKSDFGRNFNRIGNELRLNRLQVKVIIDSSVDIRIKENKIDFNTSFQFGIKITLKHRDRYIIDFLLGSEPGGKGDDSDPSLPDFG